MLHNTRGIVLHHIKYSETSVIAKIYTELFGLQSYLINGVRKKKSKIKINILQPLTFVEMVVYHKEKGGLQRIKEIANNNPFSSLPYETIKRSIALFIAEILYKTIREEEANKNLFEFLFNSIQILDLTNSNCSNFHLLFLLKLSEHLGFFPNGKYSENKKFFDLKEGIYTETQPEYYYVAPPLSECLSRLSENSFEQLNQIKINQDNRKMLLKHLIEYYELHLPGINKIKSNHVLETVMS